VLLEQKVSNHRMGVGILVVVLNTTSCIPLPELTDFELLEGVKDKAE
jgi:hypothetical protein